MIFIVADLDSYSLLVLADVKTVLVKFTDHMFWQLRDPSVTVSVQKARVVIDVLLIEYKFKSTFLQTLCTALT